MSEMAILTAKFDEIIKYISFQNPNRIFSIDEAARYFGIGEKRLAQAVLKGELPCYRINNRDKSLRQKDIEAWIDSKRESYGRNAK